MSRSHLEANPFDTSMLYTHIPSTPCILATVVRIANPLCRISTVPNLALFINYSSCFRWSLLVSNSDYLIFWLLVKADQQFLFLHSLRFWLLGEVLFKFIQLLGDLFLTHSTFLQLLHLLFLLHFYVIEHLLYIVFLGHCVLFILI